MIYQPTDEEREDDAKVGRKLVEDFDDCDMDFDLLGHIIREYDRDLYESILTRKEA